MSLFSQVDLEHCLQNKVYNQHRGTAREMEIPRYIHRRNWKGSRAQWSAEGISSLSLLFPLDTSSIFRKIRKPEVRSSPFRRAPSPKAIVANWMTPSQVDLRWKS